MPLVVPGGAGGQSPFSSPLLPNSLGLVVFTDMADVQSFSCEGGCENGQALAATSDAERGR